MLLDRCDIATSFPINPAVFVDRPAFNAKHGTDILESAPTSRQFNRSDHRSHRLAFGSFGGIDVFADEIAPGRWDATSIQLNPRKILFRHNGNGLSVDEALTAFSFVVEEVSHILANPKDKIHILPAIHPRSRAYWRRVEIPLDLHDLDGTLRRIFRNPHFPNMSEGARYKNGNVQIGSRDGPFRIVFYRKDQKMQKLLRKYGVSNAPPVFRIEITLARGKLLEHLGKPGNVKLIGGHQRLVRLPPQDLIACHRDAVTQLLSCFKVVSAGTQNPGKDKLGRFMAAIAYQHDIPLVDLFNLYEVEISCGARTSSRHREAARKAFAAMSPLRLEEVFTEDAYHWQPRIEIPDLERLVSNQRKTTPILPEIRQAYSDR